MNRHSILVACVLLTGVSAATPAVAQSPDVRDLIAKLEGKDAAARVEAADALGQLGPKAGDAVPTLVEALKADDTLLRHRAAIALGHIHAHPELAVPALRRAIKDGDRKVARAAVSSLGDFGPEAKDAVPDLLELAASDDYDLKIQAVGSLAPIRSQPEKVVPLYHAILKGKNERFLKAVTAGAVVYFPPEPKTVELLRSAFECEDVDDEDRKETIRESVVQAMGHMGPHAKAQVPWLVGLFKDFKRGRSLRREAFLAVGRLGTHAREAVPDVVECLNDRRYWGAELDHVIKALALMGEPAVELLVKNLNHREPDARSHTVQALGAMGPRAAAAVPAVEKAALDGDTGVSRHAAIALEQIKAPQKPK